MNSKLAPIIRNKRRILERTSRSPSQNNVAGKILVISSVAPHRLGGIQNLYALLSVLKPHQYSILTTYESIRRDPAREPLPGEYFYCDRKRAQPLSLIIPPPATEATVRSSRPGSRFNIRAEHARFVGYCRRLFRFATPRYRAVRSVVRFFATIGRMVLWGHLIVQRGNIRGVVGISDTGPALISTYLLSKLCRLPYVIYMFDLYFGNNLGIIENCLARTLEPRILRRAAAVFLTNEAITKYYRLRYGHTIKPLLLHNSIFPAQYERLRTPPETVRPHRIVFTGTVYWAQEQSMLNMIHAMDELRDAEIILDLYIPNLPQSISKHIANRNNIRMSAAPVSEMPRIQCGASILYLPLSWNTPSPDIIATATPGKLSDYLASGRPILIHAPPYAWVSHYAKQEGFGLVVDEENIQKLRDGVLKLLTDKRLILRLARNATRTFYKNHDATKTAPMFVQMLDSAFGTRLAQHDSVLDPLANKEVLAN
jgi:glycosyltransferase involved in cell wall biosynthesis